MIADIMTNEKLQAVVKELFIRCRKLNILPVFSTQFNFSVPEDLSLNLTHYLIMNINKNKKNKNKNKKKITKYRNKSFCRYRL